MAVVVGLVTVVLVRCTADNGDAAADLVRARSLLDGTSRAAGIKKAQGFAVDGIAVCMDGFSTGRTSLKYPLDLNGQDPAVVLGKVEDFWSASGSDIVGVTLKVDTRRDALGQRSEVIADGGGWYVALQEQLSHPGVYEFVADGPCTGNTHGSIGPAAP